MPKTGVMKKGSEVPNQGGTQPRLETDLTTKDAAELHEKTGWHFQGQVECLQFLVISGHPWIIHS